MALGSDVVSIQPGPPFTLVTSNGLLRARHLVFAIPAWRIAQLVGTFDADLAQTCAAIPYASTATISLAYRRDEVAGKLAGTGFVVPRGESSTRLLAASWVTSKWPDRAPEDVVLLRAFAGGVLDADQLELDDAELVSQAHRDLAPLLGLAGQATPQPRLPLGRCRRAVRSRPCEARGRHRRRGCAMARTVAHRQRVSRRGSAGLRRRRP